MIVLHTVLDRKEHEFSFKLLQNFYLTSEVEVVNAIKIAPGVSDRSKYLVHPDKARFIQEKFVDYLREIGDIRAHEVERAYKGFVEPETSETATTTVDAANWRSAVISEMFKINSEIRELKRDVKGIRQDLSRIIALLEQNK